jgi:hypothetical protein
VQPSGIVKAIGLLDNLCSSASRRGSRFILSAHFLEPPKWLLIQFVLSLPRPRCSGPLALSKTPDNRSSHALAARSALILLPLLPHTRILTGNHSARFRRFQIVGARTRPPA